MFGNGLAVQVAPGQRFIWNQVLAFDRKVFVTITAPPLPAGRPAAYASQVVIGDRGPIGAIFGTPKSLLVTDLGVYFDGMPEAAFFGGWFLSFYVVNSSNAVPLDFLVALNIL